MCAWCGSSVDCSRIEYIQTSLYRYKVAIQVEEKYHDTYRSYIYSGLSISQIFLCTLIYELMLIDGNIIKHNISQWSNPFFDFYDAFNGCQQLISLKNNLQTAALRKLLWRITSVLLHGQRSWFKVSMHNVGNVVEMMLKRASL